MRGISSFFRRSTGTDVEVRSIDSVPWDAGGTSTSGSVVVSEARARRLAPVYAAHRHLADGIATLPLKGYRRIGTQREPMGSLPQLLQFLEDEGTLVDWLTKLVMGLAGAGESIGLILGRDGFGFPTNVLWRPHSEWSVDDRFPGRPKWFWMGREIDRSELVHVPWLTVAGRTRGLSPIDAFALTVTGGLSAQQYGNDWYAAGGVPPGTFKNNAIKVDQNQADVIKARLVAAIRTRQPIVYGADWDYNAITISPEQAQLVESLRLTANQIAAIYGIAPEEVGGEAANSLTYANEEMRQTTRLHNLRPWLVRIEAALSALLPERQYVRFAADATVRADIATRWAVYKTQREIGYRSLDEIRALEDEPALPDGQGASYEPLAKPTAGRELRDGFPVIDGRRLPELTWTNPE